MKTVEMLRCNKVRSHLSYIEEMVDDFGVLSENNDRYESALEEIANKDFGLLGGDESWSVDQWHDYIREVIAEFQVIAKEVL